MEEVHPRTLRWLYAGAAALHLVQSIVVFALVPYLNGKHAEEGGGPRGRFTVTRTVRVWHAEMAPGVRRSMVGGGLYVVDRVDDVGDFDVRYAIGSFFLLSGLFQAAQAALVGYNPNTNRGLPPDTDASSSYPRSDEEQQWQTQWQTPPYVVDLRFVARMRLAEYSFTASLMMLCIALESGVQDLYTLILIFACTFACMKFGLLADVLSTPEVQFALERVNEPEVHRHNLSSVSHTLGWILLVLPWYVILDAYSQAQNASGVKAPGFVTAIVVSQPAMFALFGLVQWLQLARSISDSLAEAAYACLSLTAKTLLAWLIVAPALT